MLFRSPTAVHDGVVDRVALARAVFTDEGAKARLEALVHPEVARQAAAARAAAGPDRVVVYDVPLLVEKAMAALKAQGAPLLDEKPRPGAGGARVAFVHPKGSRGVLVELRQGPSHA